MTAAAKRRFLFRERIVKLPRRDAMNGQFASDHIRIVVAADRSDRMKPWFRAEFFDARQPAQCADALLATTSWDSADALTENAMGAMGLSPSEFALTGGSTRKRTVLYEVLDLLEEVRDAIDTGGD
jgi:hypothetical protein